MHQHQTKLIVRGQRRLSHQRQGLIRQVGQIGDHHHGVGREQAAADQVCESAVREFGSSDLGDLGVRTLASGNGHLGRDRSLGEQRLGTTDQQGAAEDLPCRHGPILPANPDTVGGAQTRRSHDPAPVVFGWHGPSPVLGRRWGTAW